MNRDSLPGLPELQPGNIFCIGRNYAAHARELNNPVPERPVIFTKSSSSLCYDGKVVIPAFVKEPHYETEVVAAISREGKNIPAGEALQHIAGYAVGIDVTARDIQTELKEKSHPWFLAKSLDTFAPVSSFVSASEIADPNNITFSLEVNGERRQTGDTSQMLFPIDLLIATLSKYVTLKPGDLIFTGTPEGVGRLHPGDYLHAELQQELITLDVTIAFEN